MRIPSYADSVEWIADVGPTTDVSLVVALVADQFGRHVEQVEADVVDKRAEMREERLAMERNER